MAKPQRYNNNKQQHKHQNRKLERIETKKLCDIDSLNNYTNKKFHRETTWAYMKCSTDQSSKRMNHHQKYEINEKYNQNQSKTFMNFNYND
jgi:hypothetical protein